MSEVVLERLGAASPSPRPNDVGSPDTAASADGAWRRAAVLCRHLLSEPFLHFLLLGSVLFGVDQHLEARSRYTHIAITPQIVQGIAENYRLQYGSLPSPQRLDALVDARIREEVFYREALRLGLDKDDEIVRRRLVQKYEFVQQDLGIVSEPGEQALRAFFDARKRQYEIPGTVSFSHVYFSTDTRGEGAYADAARTASALTASDASRATDAGDPFPGPTDFARASAAELGRVFGRRGLSSEVFTIDPNRWSTPIASGLGWHILYVNSREPARTPNFDEVRDVVRGDYLEAERARSNARAYEKLKSSFVIERE